MINFQLLIIGDNIEEQLKPYLPEKPQISTEINLYLDKYHNEFIDMIEVFKNGKITYHHPHDNMFYKTENEYTYPLNSIKRIGNPIEFYPRFEDYLKVYHNIIKENNTYYKYVENENKKFDWFVIGGRWSDFFTLNNGEQTNSAKLMDININLTFEKAIEEANYDYDEVESVLRGRKFPSWNKIYNKYQYLKDGNKIFAEATKEYESYQVVKDFREEFYHINNDFYDEFGNSREEYIEKCKFETMLPTAFIKDGKWYQYTGETKDKEWHEKYWNMINSLHPATTLTIIHCNK